MGQNFCLNIFIIGDNWLFGNKPLNLIELFQGDKSYQTK